MNEVSKEMDNYFVRLDLTAAININQGIRAILQNIYTRPYRILPEFLGDLENCLNYLQDLINMTNWKDVSIIVRKAFSILSFVKLYMYFNLYKTRAEFHLYECFKILDYGLIFGSPLDDIPDLLQKCSLLLAELQDNVQLTDIKAELVQHTHNNELETINNPSIETFYRDYVLTEKPIIIKNHIDHWPAMSKWHDLNYIMNIARFRTVPVEIGSKYTDHSWTQSLMSMERFITEYIIGKNNKKGYLAQYQLFEQIPQLKHDIKIPDYCAVSENENDVDVNAWFGPEGTVSPLHYDIKRNLLCQIVGWKELILFSPEDTKFLYPYQNKMLFNTSKVNPVDPDLQIHSLFVNAKPIHCILQPGDMLYIPPKWWHYVKSLSISFSVSFWWD